MLQALAEIVRNYQDQFGIAIIFIAYTVVALIAAMLLFGITRFASTGSLTGPIPSTNLNIVVGGAAAGFLITAIVLLAFHVNYVPQPGTMQVTGNVFWKEDQRPVEGATVSVDGANVASVRTNAEGFFIVTLPPGALMDKTMIRARLGEASSSTELQKQRIKGISLLLQKPANPDPMYQKKFDLHLTLSEDVTLFLNSAKRTDDAFRELTDLRAKRVAKSQIETKEVQFNSLKSQVDVLFSRVKREYEAIGLVYETDEVKKARDEFGAWWDELAKAEGRIEVLPGLPGQTKFHALLAAMKKELGK